MIDDVRVQGAKPLCLTWQSPPQGTLEDLAARGIYTFNEHGRAVRTMAHLVRYARELRHRIRRLPCPPAAFPWSDFAGGESAPRVVSEHVVARILEAAGLAVARGRVASTTDDAVRAAAEVGFPVAIKGLSPAVTHRAAAGLLALDVETPEAVARLDRALRERAAARGVVLEGTWVQHMFSGRQELLVTAFRDQELGVMVGCGMGGGMTEIIDDVAFARAPIDGDGAFDLLGALRTLRRLPQLLSEPQRRAAADFIARFSVLAASAPWRSFTLEVNPLKVGADDVAAVDGLLLIE
jgi:acetyltransferase